MTLNLKKESAFAKWYAKNKERLSDKRKRRYAEDVEYRKRAIEASKKRRRGEVTPTTPPEDAPISFAEAADRSGVGKSVLHAWLNKKFFPGPKRHHGRRIWFSEAQITLLKELKDRVHGQRRWYGKLDRFKDVIAYVFANWD